MTGVAAYTLAFLLSQSLQVRVAPDQPAPIFFTDEPLVAQFETLEPTAADVDVRVTLPNGERATWSAHDLAVPGGRPMWQAIESLPVARGPHSILIRFATSTGTSELDRSLQRLDRPPTGSLGVVGVHLTDPTDEALYGLRCLPVARVRLDIDVPNLASVVQAIVRDTPGHVYLRVPPGSIGQQRSLGAIAQEIGRSVDLWEIAGADGPARYTAIVNDIRQGDPAARIAARVSAARDAVALLRVEPQFRPVAFVVSPDAVDAVEQATERAGVEGISLLIEFNPALGADIDAARLVPRVLAMAQSPHHEVVLPQRLIEQGEGFSNLLAVFASATRLLEQAEIISTPVGTGHNQAWVFARRGDVEPAEWTAAVAHIDPNEPAAELSSAGVSAWTLMDAYGNVRAASGEAGTEIGPPPGYGLWWVQGTGGSFLLEAHIRRMKAHAKATAPHETALTAIAPDTITALQLLRNYSYPAPTRLQFFNVVRALPAIEEDWHRGIVETRDAIPLSRHLAAIARELATIKQEADEQFLEPFDRTIANCRTFLEQFSTAAIGADAHRVAFLRAEVVRLLDEARACEAAGRITEAKGIAALAEWRARSLEPAATLAIMQPDEESPPEEAGGVETDSEADESQPVEGEIEP